MVEHEFIDLYNLHRNPTGVALTGPLAIGAVALCAGLRWTPVSSGAALALGSLTYPLYLLHQHIGYAVFARFGSTANRWVILVALLAALLALAFAIGRWIEPPCRRWILARARALLARSPSAARPLPA